MFDLTYAECVARIAKTMQTARLGGYLQACFPGWLKELEDHRSQEFHTELISICNGSATRRYKATKGRQHCLALT